MCVCVMMRGDLLGAYRELPLGKDRFLPAAEALLCSIQLKSSYFNEHIKEIQAIRIRISAWG